MQMTNFLVTARDVMLRAAISSTNIALSGFAASTAIGKYLKKLKFCDYSFVSLVLIQKRINLYIYTCCIVLAVKELCYGNAVHRRHGE